MINLKKLLAKLERDRRGAAMATMVIGLVVTIVVVIIALMVALLITGQLSAFSATVNYQSAANNATAATLFTNTFSALSLATILPFILVAALIIAAITGIMAFVAYRRRD